MNMYVYVTTYVCVYMYLPHLDEWELFKLKAVCLPLLIFDSSVPVPVVTWKRSGLTVKSEGMICTLDSQWECSFPPPELQPFPES